MSFIPALDIPVTCDKKIRISAVPGLELEFETPCTLQSQILRATEGRTGQLLLESTIETEEKESLVYRGKLDGRAVVVKSTFAAYECDQASRLREEVRSYSEMKRLQGIEIPRFYNFVKGLTKPKTRRMRIREPHVMVTCIIIEDCGEDVGSFGCLNRTEKMSVLETLGRLHKKGFIHDNPIASHVVGTSENYRLISLRRVGRHICDWNGEYSDWDPKEVDWKLPCIRLASEWRQVMS